MGSRLIVVGIFFQMKLLNVHPLLVGIEGLRCGLYAAELSGFIVAFKNMQNTIFNWSLTKFVLPFFLKHVIYISRFTSPAGWTCPAQAFCHHWKDGISLLLSAGEVADRDLNLDLKQLCGMVMRCNLGGLQRYLGSPILALQWLRSQDEVRFWSEAEW